MSYYEIKPPYIWGFYGGKQMYMYLQHARKKTYVCILSFSIYFDKCLHYIYKI